MLILDKYDLKLSPLAIHTKIWDFAKYLQPKIITTLGNDTSLDVNTSQALCLKSIVIAELSWSDNIGFGHVDLKSLSIHVSLPEDQLLLQ